MVDIHKMMPGCLKLVQAGSCYDGLYQCDLFLLEGNVVEHQVHEIISIERVNLAAARENTGVSSLKIAHFNDFHGCLMNLSPSGDEPVFSRMVTRLHQLRAECQHDESCALLVLSGGDDLNGSMFSELLGRVSTEINVHAAYRVYNAAGIHACGIGNHELDLGMDMLTKSISHEAAFPLLSANLMVSSDYPQVIHPAAILVIKGLRIGIVGLTTQAEIHRFASTDFEIVDAVRVCRNILPALRPYCDVVILLSHLGYNLQSKNAIVEKVGDCELAEQLEPEWVDLIVGAHTHETLNCQGLEKKNIVNGIPIVQAGAHGRWLGEVTLIKQDKFRVSEAHLTTIMDVSPDEEFEQRVIKPIYSKLQPIRRRVLGMTADHPDVTDECILDFFARDESALANLMVDALVERCRIHGYQVDCAMLDRTCLARGLKPGSMLTFEDCYRLMPHMDNILIYTISGAQLIQLINDNSRRIDGWGEPKQERGFAHFSRVLRYNIITGHSRREARAVDVMYDGILLSEQPEHMFLIATNCFFHGLCRAWEKKSAPGDVLVINSMDLPVFYTHLFIRDEIVQYLFEHGGATEEAGVRRDGRLHIISP